MTKLIAWIDARWWVKTLLLPLLATAPPVLLAEAKWNSGFESYLKETPQLRYLMMGWPLVMVFAACIYEWFQPPKTVSASDFGTLLEVLHGIVGLKVARFVKALQQLRQDGDFKAKKVFTTITKPDDQLEAIVAGIYQFFEATGPPDVAMQDLGIRVALAKMGEKHIDGFEVFSPPGKEPRSLVKDLQREDCGFSRAKEKREIVIVEDFVAESTGDPYRSYAITSESRREEKGSMICYPVIVRATQEIPFVISICSAKSKLFKKADAAYYTKILEHFEQRITLEYCLKQLRGITK